MFGTGALKLVFPGSIVSGSGAFPGQIRATLGQLKLAGPVTTRTAFVLHHCANFLVVLGVGAVKHLLVLLRHGPEDVAHFLLAF